MDTTERSPCRVLVVEDDVALGEMITALLPQPRYDPVWITTGQAALATLQGESALPALILLDLMLPDIDGEQVYAILDQQSRWRSIPVIVMSAVPGAAARTSTLSRATYLPKPFDPEHLLALVAHSCP